MWAMPAGERFPSLARRLGALALDVAIGVPIVVLAVAVGYAISGHSLARFDALARYAVTAGIVYALYFAFWESSPTRATPGKILLDLRVATASGKPLSFTEAMLRFLLRVATLVTLNAGFWRAWWNPRGQAVHDDFCRTVVVAPQVTTGELRRAERPRRREDLATAFLATVLAWLVVFALVPVVVRDAALADRFETAIAELTPVFADGAFVASDGRWSRRLRLANDAIAAQGLAIDVDDAQQAIVVRATVDTIVEDAATRLLDPPSIRLARSGSASLDPVWSCRDFGTVSYLLLARCQKTPAIEHPIPWLTDVNAAAH
jgi:uncharacterized RDD family membrane protein YckC